MFKRKGGFLYTIRPTLASYISHLPVFLFFFLFFFSISFYLHRLRHGSRHPILGVRPVPVAVSNFHHARWERFITYLCLLCWWWRSLLDKHVHTQGVGQESISFDPIAGPATRDGLPCQAAIMKPKVLLSVQIQSKKAKMAVKVTSWLFTSMARRIWTLDNWTNNSS